MELILPDSDALKQNTSQLHMTPWRHWFPNVVLISGKAILNSSFSEDITPRFLDSDTLAPFRDNVCR